MSFFLNNFKAIKLAFEMANKVMILYKDGFDDLYADYILNKNIDRRYELNIILRVYPNDTGQRLYNSFIKFLRQFGLDERSKTVKFHKITFHRLPDDI